MYYLINVIIDCVQLKPDACYLVRGENTLVDLRDIIQCQSDLAVNKDYSSNPMSVDPNEFAKVIDYYY